MGPKISVIMLTYNRENLVGKAIESVLSQTLRDFELVVVDNGSTDGSGALADRYAANDSRVRVIHRERGNIGSGRNVGLDAATGGFVAFIDDDDTVESDYLEFLHSLVLEYDGDAAICGTNFLNNDCKFVINGEEAIITLMWRKHYNNGFPTKLFRRELFSGLRFEEHGRYDDIGLMYLVLAKAKRVVYHGLPKYTVYRHNNNNSAPTDKNGRITAEYIASYREAYRVRRGWLNERFPDNVEYWSYFDWSFQLSMVNKIVSNNVAECSRHLQEMKKELSEHYDEFLASPRVQDFEREWIKRYLGD